METRSRQLHEQGRIQVIYKETTIRVRCPYHGEFISAAKQLHGYWLRDLRMWSFHERYRAEVYRLLTRIYGVSQSHISRCVGHRFLKVAGGIRCMNCGLFKERGL